MQTSNGDTFDQHDEVFGGSLGAGAQAVGDPVGRLMLVTGGITPYAPTFIDVEVFERGTSVGSARFDQLAYHCHAITADDWCWNADPVTLVLDND
jgi:hypothetical protein